MTTALACDDQPREGGDGEPRERRHLLDLFVPDPSELAPWCDEPEFAALVAEMVADAAPRLFAVVQEYGERLDARVAAWGLAFADHAEVVLAAHGARASLPAPERALLMFTLGSHIRARLVWVNTGSDPDAPPPRRNDDACDDQD